MQTRRRHVRVIRSDLLPVSDTVEGGTNERHVAMEAEKREKEGYPGVTEMVPCAKLKGSKRDHDKELCLSAANTRECGRMNSGYEKLVAKSGAALQKHNVATWMRERTFRRSGWVPVVTGRGGWVGGWVEGVDTCAYKEGASDNGELALGEDFTKTVPAPM